MRNNSAIRFLRSGIVPVLQVRVLSVGYATLDAYLSKHFEAFSHGKKIDPLFVRGEWGSGKSHFLAYVESTALQREIPVTSLALNARTSALNYPQRMYSQLTAGLRYRECVGLREYLLSRLSEQKFRSDLLGALGGSDSPLAKALRYLCEQFVGQTATLLSLSSSFAWSPILGADIDWADYPYKREQALNRLDELSGILRRAGAYGIAVLLDELETIDQLWNVRSRSAAYAVLGRLCRNPNILPVFAITERFDRVLDADLDRGLASSEGIPSEARWFLQGWKRREWQKLQPPDFSREAACGVLDNVSRIYAESFNCAPLTVAQKTQCIAEWERNPGRNPRQLIRLAVDTLDRSRPLQSIRVTGK